MNKVFKLKLIIIVLLLGGVCQIYASSQYTNRTFLMPRPVGVNLPMEYSGFDKLYDRNILGTFGGNIQVVPFYQESADSTSLAKYFLFNKKSLITLPRTNALGTTTVSTAQDLDLGYIIHQRTNAATPVSATITMSPKVNTWGIRFDYYSDLSRICSGMFAYVNAPIASVESNMELHVASTDAATKTNLEKFFRGEYLRNSVEVAQVVAPAVPPALPVNVALNAANGDGQAALTRAKISGKHSEISLANVDVGLGYAFLDKDFYTLTGAVAVTLPLGNKPEGIYAFEPIVGNGKHFGLGGDVHAQFYLWEYDEHSITCSLYAKCRYLFEHMNQQTLGIKGRNWGAVPITRT